MCAVIYSCTLEFVHLSDFILTGFLLHLTFPPEILERTQTSPSSHLLSLSLLSSLQCHQEGNMRHMDADDNPLILTLMTDCYPCAAHPHLVLTHPGWRGRELSQPPLAAPPSWESLSPNDWHENGWWTRAILEFELVQEFVKGRTAAGSLKVERVGN